MNIQKTKILLISASGKTGGGPSHIFLLKELLEDEFDFYLAMPSFNSKSIQFDKNKYLEIAERKILLMDVIRLVMFFVYLRLQKKTPIKKEDKSITKLTVPPEHQ